MGALFLCAGYLFFAHPGWSMTPLLAAGLLVWRWPKKFLKPSRSVTLVAAVIAWLPLAGLMWLRERRLQSGQWKDLVPSLSDHGLWVIQWAPLFTGASLLSFLAMLMLSVGAMPWRAHPQVEVFRKAALGASSACLGIFFALFLFRVGLDFAVLGSR